MHDPPPTRLETRAVAVAIPRSATDWVVLIVPSLVTPVHRDELAWRLEGLHRAIPLVGATLRGETWLPGEPGSPVVIDDEPVGDPRLDAPFDLARGPPRRVVLGLDRRRLALACHHAAFDGLAPSRDHDGATRRLTSCTRHLGSAWTSGTPVRLAAPVGQPR